MLYNPENDSNIVIYGKGHVIFLTEAKGRSATMRI